MFLDSLQSTKYVDKNNKMDDTIYSRNQFKTSKTSSHSPTGEAPHLRKLPNIDDYKGIELRDLDELQRKENYHAIKRSKWDQITLIDSLAKNQKASHAEQLIADMRKQNHEIIKKQINENQKRRQLSKQQEEDLEAKIIKMDNEDKDEVQKYYANRKNELQGLVRDDHNAKVESKKRFNELMGVLKVQDLKKSKKEHEIHLKEKQLEKVRSQRQNKELGIQYIQEHLRKVEVQNQIKKEDIERSHKHMLKQQDQMEAHQRQFKEQLYQRLHRAQEIDQMTKNSKIANYSMF